MENEKESQMKIERRCLFQPAELRVAGEEGKPAKIEGYAALFNSRTVINGWFEEEIAPGAFGESIKADDIRALFNHDPSQVLGRNLAKTATLAEDEKGLRVAIEPPDTNAGRDVVELLRRGDVTGMSFGFETLEEEHRKSAKEGGLDLRILKKVRLFDVSVATYPAYEDTTVAVRSMETWRKEVAEPQAGTAAAGPETEPARPNVRDVNRQMIAELE